MKRREAIRDEISILIIALDRLHKNMRHYNEKKLNRKIKIYAGLLKDSARKLEKYIDI